MARRGRIRLGRSPILLLRQNDGPTPAVATHEAAPELSPEELGGVFVLEVDWDDGNGMHIRRT